MREISPFVTFYNVLYFDDDSMDESSHAHKDKCMLTVLCKNVEYIKLIPSEYNSEHMTMKIETTNFSYKLQYKDYETAKKDYLHALDVINGRKEDVITDLDEIVHKYPYDQRFQMIDRISSEKVNDLCDSLKNGGVICPKCGATTPLYPFGSNGNCVACCL